MSRSSFPPTGLFLGAALRLLTLDQALKRIGGKLGLESAVGLGSTYVGLNVGWAATNRLRADLARHLLHLDADVTAIADAISPRLQPRAELLEALGARFRVGAEATGTAGATALAAAYAKRLDCPTT